MSLEPTNIRKEMTSDFRVPNDGGMGRVKRRMKRMKMNWAWIRIINIISCECRYQNLFDKRVNEHERNTGGYGGVRGGNGIR